MICSIYKGKQIEFYDLIIMIHMTVCIDLMLYLLYETFHKDENTFTREEQ